MSAAALARAQGVFYLLTGLWPFVHLRSFLKVTGPKRELWLLYTASVLICAVGAALLRGGGGRGAGTLGAGAAAGLGAIDVIYVARRRIKPTYLLDAVMEGLIVGAWWRAR